MTIDGQCISCKRLVRIDATPEQSRRYVDGVEPMQKIFPEVTPDDREVFITGVCGGCYKTATSGYPDTEYADELSIT